jgi:hypothetical protein
MPHVIALRIPQRRSNALTGQAQAIGQVIILAAPTYEAFVEAVDVREVIPRDSYIVTRQLWLRCVARQVIVKVFNPLLKKPLTL